MPGSGPNGHGPGAGPTPDEMAVLEAVQPRPMPTAWTTRVVPFSNGTERKVMVELTILTPTGSCVTYWAPADLSRMISDLRSVTKQAAQEQSGLITPPSGLIIPGPTTGG